MWYFIISKYFLFSINVIPLKLSRGTHYYMKQSSLF